MHGWHTLYNSGCAWHGILYAPHLRFVAGSGVTYLVNRTGARDIQPVGFHPSCFARLDLSVDYCGLVPNPR